VYRGKISVMKIEQTIDLVVVILLLLFRNSNAIFLKATGFMELVFVNLWGNTIYQEHGLVRVYKYGSGRICSVFLLFLHVN